MDSAPARKRGAPSRSRPGARPARGCIGRIPRAAAPHGPELAEKTWKVERVGAPDAKTLSFQAGGRGGYIVRQQPVDGWRGLSLVFAVGFFSLAAQALLFRTFLTVFEGNELGIACFFASWLTWVAIGAFAARSRLRFMLAITARFELLPLLFFPAFLLQAALLGGARELAGVEPYELFPLVSMLPSTFIANAPVGFCTGLLFTLGCRWLGDKPGLPVARVYIWESIGSFAGAVTATFLLARGVASEQVFLVVFLPVTLALAACPAAGWLARIPALLPAAAVAALLLSGSAARWERHNSLQSWRRLLPRETYGGTFTTPDATYQYGECDGQFNVAAWETVTDTIPSTEHASEVIALHLAQRPQARRFLVVGRGAFALCRRLLDLPQADTITWIDPDPAYPSTLLRVLPARFQPGVERLDMPRADIRRWLASATSTYDVVFLSLPDATTLALNRYFTREFLLLLKSRVAASGLVGMRVAAGENYMSDERVNTGASAFRTLRSVFAHTVIKPGEESWLLASDGPGLTTAPALLRERFSAIPGAAALYPPDGLFSLYLPERMEYQATAYAQAALGAAGELLLNTERTPRALLHGLLFAAREAGGATRRGSWIRTFALAGAPVLPAGILLFALLRTVYRRRNSARETAPALLDPGLLLFTTGAAGMGGNIVLMYMYQSEFGTIFLHVGLITALFMLGLTAGGALASRFLARSAHRAKGFLSAVLLPHSLLCVALARPGTLTTHAAFAAAFVISGLLCGAYVPVAARRLSAAGVAPDRAGARVEALDNLGGAAGGLLFGLLLLPVFGSTYSLALLAALLLTNAVDLLPRPRESYSTPPPRRAGYVLFGLVAFTLASGLFLHRGGPDDVERSFLSFAHAAAGGGELRERRRELPDGTQLQYFEMAAALPGATNSNVTYAFTTDKLAPATPGYGGPVTLAALTDAGGALRDVTILPSRETPAYLDYLAPWLQRLRGQQLFVPEPLKGFAAVTGATRTSAAVLQLLRAAGPAFAGQVLGMDVVASPAAAQGTSHGAVAWLVVSAAAALFLRSRPSRLGRRILLVLVIVLSGFVFNAQYSLAHVFSLLELKVPTPGWNAGFLLAVGCPLLVALFGNLYCGYLCPFGALQEFIGDLRPASLRTDPDKRAWGRIRAVKYALLALLTLIFGTMLHSALASGDPLTTVFGLGRSLFVAGLAVLLMTLAFFYPRVWCRGVCPAGAFLALLNGLRIFRRAVPPIAPAACVYGMRESRELDCICCDRCRRPGPQERHALARPAGWAAPPRVNAALLAAALALACTIAATSITAWRRDIARQPLRGTEFSGWGARPANMERLRPLVRQGTLSDHEALYYRRSPAVPPGPPPGTAP